MPADLGPWSPLTPAGVDALFSAPAGPPLTWWLSGGEALDLFVGRRTRRHEDIDVSILGVEAICLPHILSGWDLHLAHDGALLPWDGSAVMAPHNSLWCRPDPGAPWALQVMLEDSDRDHWVCRRFRDLSVPLADVVRRSPDGVPYMAPHVQLFMKAKDHRPKDDADFALVAPLLEPHESEWLSAALARYQPGHHWLS